VGRKGSGKTAVLEAIRLLFGGLGRERASRLSEFIKHGSSKSIIRAKIRNRVYVPGRSWIRFIETLPDTAEIVIEREIHSDGQSVFRLNGKQVPRQRIIQMLSKANISARNTLFFLPQERVNAWIHLSAKERISLLLSALGLKELKEKIDLVKEEISSRLKEREKYSKMLEEWERILQEKQKELLPPRTARDRLIRYYILKLAYLVYRKTNIEEEIRELQEKIDSLDEKIGDVKKLIDDFEKQKEEIDATLEKLKQEWETLVYKEKIGYEYELKEAERKINDYQGKLHEIRERYERELAELEEIRNSWGSSNVDDLRSLIEDKRSRIQLIDAELSSDRDIMHIHALEDEIDELLNEKNRLLGELEESREHLRTILRRLDPRGNLENLFFKLRESRMPHIYGPIIFEIRLKMPISRIREYGKAIENALGYKFLSSFIALHPESYRKFVRLIRSMRGAGGVEIITFSRAGEEKIIGRNPYEIAKQIVSEARKRREKLKNTAQKTLREYQGLIAFWMCDVIDGSLPALAIVESRNWDVPIVVDSNAASIVMDKLNLRKAVTIDGELIERRVDPLTRNVIYTIKAILSEESSENIFSMLGTFNYEYFKTFEDRILSQINEIERQITKLRSEIRYLRENLPERIRALDAEKRRLEEEIIELKRVVARVESINSRLASLPEDRKNVLHAIEVLQKRIDEISDKIAEIDAKAEGIKKKIEELEALRERLIDEYSDNLAKLKSLEREKEELPARIKGLEREKNMMDQEINRIRKELIAIFEILRRLKEYPEEADLNTIVKKEVIEPAERLIDSMHMEELREELAFLEKQIESLKEGIIKMETRIEEISEAIQNIKNYRKKLEEINSEIEDIRRLYEEELKEIMNQLYEKVNLINMNYQRILELLGLRGEIKIKGNSIDEIELSITIDLHRPQPVELDKGGFSSGEKSTAIMAMIIAMILSSPSPLFMFDEFDVYLDDKSLYDIMKVIKTSLSRFQGIITTTHREEIISFADRIFYTYFDKDMNTTKMIMIDPKRLRESLKMKIHLS